MQFERIINYIDFPVFIFSNDGTLINANLKGKEFLLYRDKDKICQWLFDELGNLKQKQIIDHENTNNNIIETPKGVIKYGLEKIFYYDKELYFLILFIEKIKKKTRKNKDVNEYIADLSHELRTPLNGIVGFAELIIKKNLSIERIKEYVQIIYTNGVYMLRIISNVLEMAKINSGKITVYKSLFNINRLLYDLQLFYMLDLHSRNKLDINIKLELELSDSLAVLNSDEVKIKQILNNLIYNAIKYTETGEITIGYRLLNKDFIQFFVKDTGIGMTEEEINRLFMRFERGHNKLSEKYEGVGIGLDISKTYIEILGGEISVESEVGKGTTFYFVLPF